MGGNSGGKMMFSEQKIDAEFVLCDDDIHDGRETSF